MKGKILLITLVVAAVAMVIGTIVFFSLEDPLVVEDEVMTSEDVVTGYLVPEVEVEEEVEEEIEEDYSFNEELYEMYEELGYPTAQDVPSLFRDVAAAAHANGQLVESDEIIISDTERIIIATAPLRDTNAEYCGLYGQGLCFVIHLQENGGFNILQIMDTVSSIQINKEKEELGPNYSIGHWHLEGMLEGDLVISEGFGDGGSGTGKGYLLDLESLNREEIGTWTVDPLLGYTIEKDDRSVNVKIDRISDPVATKTYTVSVQISIDGNPRKEEVFEATTTINPFQMNWTESAEHQDEIWFTVEGRTYRVTAEGELIVTEL